MSLNWDASKIPDYEELTTDEEWAKTNYLMFATLILQYGWELTDKNLDEAWFRLHTFTSITGHYAYKKDGEKYYLTYADLKRRVGLSTNSGERTRAQFVKHLMTLAEREAEDAQA